MGDGLRDWREEKKGLTSRVGQASDAGCGGGGGYDF